MTTSDRTLLDAFEAVFGPTDWNRPRTYDPTADLDEETLRRSFGGLSRGARRQQRSGGYFPVVDEQGCDRDGWWVA